MGAARSWAFAQQADAPDLPPPGRTPGEVRTYLHLKERLADRYNIELTWDNFNDVNHAANNGPLILNYPTRYTDTDLRVFHYEGQTILAFYNFRNHHLTSVLPLSDMRWKLVPMEMRPREAMAKTMRLDDQNWLPAHVRTPAVVIAKPVLAIPRGQEDDRVNREPSLVTINETLPLSSFATRQAPMQQPAAATKNTEPPMTTETVKPSPESVLKDRVQTLEKLLSWAYFRSLKKGDSELTEAIQKVLMAE